MYIEFNISIKKWFENTLFCHLNIFRILKFTVCFFCVRYCILLLYFYHSNIYTNNFYISYFCLLDSQQFNFFQNKKNITIPSVAAPATAVSSLSYILFKSRTFLHFPHFYHSSHQLDFHSL